MPTGVWGDVPTLIQLLSYLETDLGCVSSIYSIQYLKALF